MLGSSHPEETTSMANPYDKYQNGITNEASPLHEPVWKQPSLDSPSVEKIPSVIVPPHGYHLGIDKEPGLLHEPISDQPPVNSIEIEPTPPVVIPPRKCRKWMNRCLGPLHEPIWEQPPLGTSLFLQTPAVPIEFGSSHKEKDGPLYLHDPSVKQQPSAASFPGKTPTEVADPRTSKKSVMRSLGPLHEPVWNQPPLETFLFQTPPEPIESDNYQKIRPSHLSHIYGPTLTQQSVGSSTFPDQTPPVAVASGNHEKVKRQHLTALHEPVWCRMPFVSYLLQRIPSPLNIPNPLYQKRAERQPDPIDASSSSQHEQSPSVTIAPHSCQKGMKRHLGPLHEPLWDQPPLGSSLLLQTPPEPIQLDNGHKKGQDQLDPLSVPDTSQPQHTTSVTIPRCSSHLGNLHEPTWCRLPIGSPCLERASSVGIIPGKGQEVGGRPLGPLHETLWE